MEFALSDRLRAVAAASILTLAAGGCAGHRGLFYQEPLPPRPMGMLTDPIWRTQEVNAEAAKFIFHEHEFEYEHEYGMNRVHLNTGGKDHLKQVAARICGGAPFPVIIERSQTSVNPYHKYKFPVHPNPDLDDRRRAVVVRGLCALGVADAESRVVVAPSFPEGLPGPQAERAYARGTMGGMGMGFGGFGGGFGGLGGMGFGGGF